MKLVSEQGESDIIISPAPLHPIVVIERWDCCCVVVYLESLYGMCSKRDEI
jgi:hypothetical protein